MNSKTVSASLSIIAWTNFLSALNPAFFCTYAALLIFTCAPIYQRQALNVLFISAIYASPLLFSGAPVHYLTSRFSTRNVITFSKVAETLIALLGMLCLWLMPYLTIYPLLGIAFLLGIDYAVYRPALKCYTAEMVPKSNLSWASGATESATFFGIVAGTVIAVCSLHLYVTYHSSPAYAGWLSAGIAAYSLVLATRLDPNLPLKRHVRVKELARQWLDTLRNQPRYHELVLTGIGESYIFASMILVAAMAIQYIGVYFEPGMNTQIHQYSIMASPVIGGGIGCLLGGWLSKKNVELGLVPMAVTAMTLIALLVGTLPYYSDFYIESGLLALLLFGFGVFAGIMLVPMQAYQEYFVRRELRPAFFAWFYFPFGIGMLIAIGLAFLMYFYKIQIFKVTLFLAVLTLALAVVTFLMMSQFLLRMLMRILLCTFYRLRIFNKERIPEDGPVLLVSNRASFVDMLFISACTTRPIRFMMHEHFYRYPLMYPLYKAAGFLEVPAGKPKRLQQLFELTSDLLRKGEIVCVFPEGDITRNGVMSGFKNGVSAMLPPEIDVPVIPLRIGMTWGSIFSYYYGKIKLRWPNELPHPASVTIGKPIPRDTSAYEIRIILSELAAETELIPSPQERPFHSQFAFIAKHMPFRRSIREFDGETWKAPCNINLLARAVMLSRYFRKISTDDQEYIGMMLPNGVASSAVLLGILMSDRFPAVMNYTSSKAANRHAVEKTKLKHIITSRAFIEKIKMEPMPEMVFLEDITPKLGNELKWIFWKAATFLLPTSELMKLISPASWKDVNRVGVVIFSSGSTGIPKGIMLSHHNITGDISAIIQVIGWRKSDRIIGNLPIFHSFGMTTGLWMPVITGAEVVMVPSPLDAQTIGKAIAERQLTVMMATPGFLQAYMRRCRPEDFKSLRLVVTGAEKLREDVSARFFKMTGLAIAECYGCSELAPIVSINLANSLLDLGTVVAKRGSIGPPVTGVSVKIVDPETFELCPEDTDGLLIVKGANVMLGYLGEPKKTAEVIRDGWYITGDIAHMNRNGFITITGRISRFSKIAGEMVPHELVEREINNILQPDRRIVAICGGEDEKRGEKLIAFYTNPELLVPEELVKKLREREIPNLWIPKLENFVEVDNLPMLGSGKLDLTHLSELARRFSETGHI